MTGGSEDSGDEQTGTDGAPDDHGGDPPANRRGVDDSHGGEREDGVGDQTDVANDRVEPAEFERSENGDGDRAPPADGEEWRYSVEEVGNDEADDEGNVAGILMRNEPLEAEPIDLENAVFFLLGSLGTIAFVVLALSSL